MNLLIINLLSVCDMCIPQFTLILTFKSLTQLQNLILIPCPYGDIFGFDAADSLNKRACEAGIGN